MAVNRQSYDSAVAHEASFKAYCIAEREMDWASVIICIWYSIHNLAQSHIHNKTLVWMSAEESNIFVVLSFHLLSAFVGCILLAVVGSKNNFPVYNRFSLFHYKSLYFWCTHKNRLLSHLQQQL